jgi:hypothetical protein
MYSSTCADVDLCNTCVIRRCCSRKPATVAEYFGCTCDKAKAHQQNDILEPVKQNFRELTANQDGIYVAIHRAGGAGHLEIWGGEGAGEGRPKICISEAILMVISELTVPAITLFMGASAIKTCSSIIC